MLQDKNKVKKIYIKIAFIITSMLIIAIGCVLSFIPNELDIEYIENTYIQPLSHFVSEKSEVVQYVVLTVSFPILFVISYKIINKIELKINPKVDKFVNFILFSLLITLIILLLMQNLNFIKDLFYGKSIVLFFILLLLVIFSIIAYQRCNEKSVKKKINNVIYIIITLFIVGIGYLYINRTYAQTTHDAHHVDAYFYPIHKINSGLTPTIDFNSIYGGYSYFFSMIMQIFKATSIYSFSCIVATLIVISLGCLAFFSSKMIKNKIILLLTVLSFIYTLVIQHFIFVNGYYLQYVPHRILFPVILLVYMVIYHKLRDKKYKNIITIRRIYSFNSSNFLEFRNRYNCFTCLDNVFRI